MKFLSEKLKGLSQGNVFDFLMMIYASFFLFSEEKFNIKGKILPVLFVLAFLSFYAGLVLKALSYRFEYAKKWLEINRAWRRFEGLPSKTSDFDSIPIEIENYKIRSWITFGIFVCPIIGILGIIFFSSQFETNVFGPSLVVALICVSIFINGTIMSYVAWYCFFGTIKIDEFIILQSKLTHWSVNLFATVCLFFSAMVFTGIFNLTLYNTLNNGLIISGSLGSLIVVFIYDFLLFIYAFLLFLIYLLPRAPLLVEDLMRFYFTVRGSLNFKVEDVKVEDRKRVFWMLVSFSFMLAPYSIQLFIFVWGNYFGLSP